MTEKEFIITVSHELTRELSESFQNGPIIDDNGCRFLTEELVANLNGLKIQIFSREHPPPHFRVEYAGETANYSIKDCDQLNGGLKKWYRNIQKWHSKNKQTLIDTWNATRPDGCTVGKYRE